MSAVYQVQHRTCYHYGEQVPMCHNLACLLPRPLAWQQVNREKLSISPDPDTLNERIDYFGNRTHYFSIQQPHESSTTEVNVEVTLSPESRPDPGPSATEWAAWRDQLASAFPPDPETLAIRPWLYESPRIPLLDELRQYALETFSETPGLIPGCMNLMGRIHREFTFDTDHTSVDTSVADAFAHRHGVCQDYSHIMIAGLRAMGLPARYMSGYIETLPPPGQPKLAGADATHAWVSVYDPAVGWVDFDPTNNLIPSRQHITIGWGRDFSDVIPVKGVVTGGENHALDVSVDVNRVK